MPNISKLTLPNNETYNLKDLRLDNYGTCNTAAETVAKTVTVNNNSFALVEGVIVTVKFTATNTAANPTLNVNSTSAKPIYYKGAAIQAGLLQANKIYTLIYNGTQYQIIGDIDSSAQVQSNWNEEDTTSLAHVLNRPAIRAGEGENSIIEGRIEDDSDATTYTIYITGDAGATTFSYTTEDTLPNLASLGSYGLFIYDNGTSNKYKYHKAIELDTSTKTITFDSALNANSGSSFVNEPLRILYKQANIANGIFSHAEGSSVAIGNASHSEGIGTIALGTYSHAEGIRTNANGGYSHAEGSGTIAAGSSSHAECSNTKALGYASHSEGNRTIAQRRSNHVFGEFNLSDTGGSGPTSKGDYIEIVGNGTADDTRSNARTLDWNGNEVLAGKLTVGAGPVNDMDVATKKYVDENAGGDATITMTSNVITLTNASGQTSSITLPVYNGAVSGGAS